MRKTITLEVEVTFSESEEQRVIQAAREHYNEVGQARVPLDDEGERWREVPAEEFIPDTVSAIMELIGANDLLEELARLYRVRKARLSQPHSPESRGPL